MFSTQSLNSIKNMFHHPAPLSPRESQQLLKSITSSFRHKLDREHGSASHESGSFTLDTRAPRSRPAAQLTDSHIRDVLSNTLLSYRKPRTTTAEAHQHHSKSAARSPPPPLARRNPVDVFDEAVAKGLMTLRAATGCMFAVQKAALEQGAKQSNVSRAHARFGIGRRVLNWLSASGQEGTLDFLSSGNTQFLRLLVQFLVIEGREYKIWEWIDRLIALEESASGNPHDTQNGARNLLWQLVVTKHAGEQISVDDQVEDVVLAGSKLTQDPRYETILYPAWSYLVHSLTRGRPDMRAGASAACIDNLLKLGRRMTGAAAVVCAHLQLYHPTTPSCDMAVDMLRSSPMAVDVMRPSSSRDGKQESLGTATEMLQVLMDLAADTLEFLVKAGRHDEAESLSKYLGKSDEAW